MKSSKILLIFIILSVSCYSFGQTIITFDNVNTGPDYSIEVLSDSNNIYRFRVQIHRLKDEQVYKNNMYFHRISFDEHTFNSIIGYPEIPSINQLIAIPDGASNDVTITDSVWTNINIGTIYPSQFSLKGEQTDTVFVYNDSVYQVPLYAPEVSSVGDDMYWRNIRNAVLSLCPFKYHPVSGLLSVMKEFTVNVRFNHRNNTLFEENAGSLDFDEWHLFSNHLGTTANSPNHIHPINNHYTNDQYDYLIILGDSLHMYDNPALKDFIKWKAFKGYKIKVTTTQTTGISQNDIWYYIKSEYNNFHFKYVLLIGDETTIPLASAPQVFNIYKGDYFYGCLDNMFDDMMADIPVGRFPTNDVSEMEKMIIKTIRYERDYAYNHDALLVIPLCQGDDNFQECMNNVADTQYGMPFDFVIADGNSVVNGGNNASNALLIGTINDLTNIVHYFGHGIESLWNWTWNALYESFGSSNVNDMNSNSLSLFWALACYTGNIEANNNILESFMRADHGTVIYLGATSESLHKANDAYSRNIYKKMLNQNVVNMGDLNVATHIKGITDNVDHASYNAFMYLLGGDPSLEIWTSQPSKIQDVQWECVDDSIVIYTDIDGPYRITVVSENGQLLERINGVYGLCKTPFPVGNFYITINRHDSYPYIIEYNLDSGFIQNRIISDDLYYFNTPLRIGYDVDSTSPFGNVEVKEGGKLHVQLGSGGVILKNGITIEKGAVLEIK